MKYDYKGILETLTKASPSHLALASFIVFPIILDYWLQAILKLFPDLTQGWKIGALVTLVLIYIACLIWMAIESSSHRKLQIKRDLILGRLTSNNWSDMGFDSAKKVLGSDCKDEEIHRVIQSYPSLLRSVKLRVKDKVGKVEIDSSGKEKYKQGVGLVKVESA